MIMAAVGGQGTRVKDARGHPGAAVSAGGSCTSGTLSAPPRGSYGCPRSRRMALPAGGHVPDAYACVHKATLAGGLRPVGVLQIFLNPLILSLKTFPSLITALRPRQRRQHL